LTKAKMFLRMVLFKALGSPVPLPAVATSDTPSGGIVKLTEHTMDAPDAKLPTKADGTQFTNAPRGKPAVTAQVAGLATLGPKLVQVKVPVTVPFAGAESGKPLSTARMSA
jgi:hypothetical protein